MTTTFVKKCKCGRIIKKQGLESAVTCECGEVWASSIISKVEIIPRAIPRIATVLAFLLLCSVTPCSAAEYSLHSVDCKWDGPIGFVMNYAKHNYDNVVDAGISLRPHANVVNTYLPRLTEGTITFEDVGMALTALRGSIRFHGSPRAMMNLGLGLVCLELQP